MEKLHILIVDDELPARKKLRALLRDIPRVGTISDAADGEEAVEQIRKISPDLVFLDIRCPGWTVSR